MVEQMSTMLSDVGMSDDVSLFPAMYSRTAFGQSDGMICADLSQDQDEQRKILGLAFKSEIFKNRTMKIMSAFTFVAYIEQYTGNHVAFV